MGYDGTLKFDTSIDSSGFQSGLSKLSGMASGAIKASGVGVGAGFLCVPAASGVRAAWCFGPLYYGGLGGVPCRYSDAGPSLAYWHGSLGATGTLKSI